MDEIEVADVRDAARKVLGRAAEYFDFAGKSADEVKRVTVVAVLGDEAEQRPREFINAAFVTMADSSSPGLFGEQFVAAREAKARAEAKRQRQQAEFERARPEVIN